MSGMAEVLAAHWSRSTHSDVKPFVDKCDGCGAVIYSWGDEPAWEGIEPLAAHQAAALSAAGFGPVKEAAAKALEGAAEAAEGMHDPIAPDCKEWAAWLRVRASAERGEA